MPELRWALVGLGVLFIAGLALWEWRRSRRRSAPGMGEAGAAGTTPQPGGEHWGRRIEPRIDSVPAQGSRGHAQGLTDEVPVIHPADALELSLPVAHESAVDVPGASGFPAPAAAESAGAFPAPAPAMSSPAATPGSAAEFDEAAEPEHRAETDPATEAVPSARSDAPVHQAQPAATSRRASQPDIRWPPERADRVLTLRLANAQGALLQGRAVRLALEQAGLVHGPQCIYHRVDAEGCVLASAANMLRPGDLDPKLMDEQQFRGLSLFSVLPGVLPPVRMLEELVALARAIAWRVGAVVQDDHGEELDGERLVKLRQSLPDAAEHGTP